MNLTKQIISILEDENNDNYDDYILSISEPWDEVREALFSILLDNDSMGHWYDICAFIYSTISKKEYPLNFTIAILHSCLEESEDLDENLVWSITKDLKKIDYLDDYDPYSDDEVFGEMKKIVRN